MDPSSRWLELEFERVGAELQVRAAASHERRWAPTLLGSGFAEETLKQFALQVRKSAARCAPLGPLLEQAQGLYRSLFQGQIQEGFLRLRGEAGNEPILLRLMLHGSALQAFPWEALCEPGTSCQTLGCSPYVLPVRGVYSSERFLRHEVIGQIRVLPIATSDGATLAELRVALDERIAAGEIQWLEPLTGERAQSRHLFDRLKREPIPHIIHFIGHGGIDEQGDPILRLGDVDGEESWIKVERLAQQLVERFRQHLCLIVLEACEGASPGALASAAELLTEHGVDAVVAHLWPVRADVARALSTVFYRALIADQWGDVALSLTDARREVLNEFNDSAEAFSPVLYLRGRDSVLFDFRSRKVAPPRMAEGAPEEMAPSLLKLLEQPFTLLLGDLWKDERVLLEDFHERLRKELASENGAMLSSLSMSALSQLYELRRGEDYLDSEIQEVFGTPGKASPLIDALARRLMPGVHITLLRLPLLELALAEQQPERSLYVVQPPGLEGREGRTALVKHREPGARRWENVDLKRMPMLDLDREVVVLRLYRGYLPPNIFMRPLVTEDDYLLGIQDLEDMLPSVPIELVDEIGQKLKRRPMLLMGMSLLAWHHRMLLYRLFRDRPLPDGSVVVLEPGMRERDLWEAGQCLPGKGGVQVIESRAPELVAPLETPAEVFP